MKSSRRHKQKQKTGKFRLVAPPRRPSRACLLVYRRGVFGRAVPPGNALVYATNITSLGFE